MNKCTSSGEKKHPSSNSTRLSLSLSLCLSLSIVLSPCGPGYRLPVTRLALSRARGALSLLPPSLALSRSLSLSLSLSRALSLHLFLSLSLSRARALSLFNSLSLSLSFLLELDSLRTHPLSPARFLSPCQDLSHTLALSHWPVTLPLEKDMGSKGRVKGEQKRGGMGERRGRQTRQMLYC